MFTYKWNYWWLYWNIENVKEQDLYEQFVSYREQYRKSKEEKENANE